MSRRDREDSYVSSFRVTLSVILALIVLAGSVMVMYPSLLYRTVPKEQVDKLTSDENVQLDEEKLGFGAFPLYPEVENVVRDCAPYIRDAAAEKPDVWGMIKRIPETEDFSQKLYSLLLISLISIPVYMLMRLLIYNAIYSRIDEGSFLLLLPLRGVASVACGISCVCVSWVFYNTVLFSRLMNAVMEWLKGFAAEKVALHGTNVFMLVVLLAAVIALIKFTVFRGSFGRSAFLGIFRGLIFMLCFAFVNVFISDWTWRVVLFGAALILVAGLTERLFDR